MTPEIKDLDICIYHDPCSDGFGAAWSVWCKFRDSIEYLPGNHATNKHDVDYWLEKVRDKHVVCFDFSFSRDLVEQMHAVAKSFQIIDHHASAAEEIGDLDYCYFDMNKSGAALAWEATFSVEMRYKLEQVPRLIQYVQDRDLWKWELPDSKAVSNYINSIPRDFKSWSVLATQLASPAGLAEAITAGDAMLTKVDMISDEIAEDAEEWEINGHTILAANCNRLMSSDVCEKLGRKGNYPFVGCYSVKDGQATWSLRSNHGTEDVSAIAQTYPGGGGHVKAAGFTVSADRMDFENKKVT
jgi:oligoribonuclease NrnB/cAMP/cGMP phosphodiesterase (DHH superfamily)